nr:unnamed protein product [Callosobruchus chinensis]
MPQKEATGTDHSNPSTKTDIKNAIEDVWIKINRLRMSSKDGLTTCDLQEKERIWDSMCRELDEDIWGQGYKISKPPMEDQVPLFSQEELLGAVGKMKKGKAPGLDGLPPEAIIDAVNVSPKWMLDLFNQLLAQQGLPES